MSRGKWNRIKENKFFNVQFYRKITTWVVLSIALNIVLCLALMYVYVHKPKRHYYSTDGVTAPILLSPMTHANESSEALLPPDPVLQPENKPLPE